MSAVVDTLCFDQALCGVFCHGAPSFLISPLKKILGWYAFAIVPCSLELASSGSINQTAAMKRFGVKWLLMCFLYPYFWEEVINFYCSYNRQTWWVRWVITVTLCIESCYDSRWTAARYSLACTDVRWLAEDSWSSQTHIMYKSLAFDESRRRAQTEPLFIKFIPKVKRNVC